MTIHVAKTGEPSQQISVAEANQRLARGELSPSDMAWHDGLPKWVPLSQIRGIIAPATSAPRAPAATPGSSSSEWSQAAPRPAQTGDGFWGGTAAYRLWNPKACAGWSILFSAVFGGFLVAKNWKSLGQPDRGTKSTIFAWVTLLLIVANIGLSLTSFGRSIAIWIPLATFAVLIIWYFTAAREQIRFIETNAPDYSRKGWGAPIGIALVALLSLVGVAVLTTVMVGARQPVPTIAESTPAPSTIVNPAPAAVTPAPTPSPVTPAAEVAVAPPVAQIPAPSVAPTQTPVASKPSPEEEVRNVRRELARKKLGRSTVGEAAALTSQFTKMLDALPPSELEQLLTAIEDWDPASTESFANLKKTLSPHFEQWRTKYGFEVPIEKNCATNLRMIDGAIEQWALENRKPKGEFVVADDLKPYLTSLPKCPDGGTYTFVTVGERPTCSIREHNTP
jgi:hypothetical protein